MKKLICITLCCASLILVTPLSGVAQENTVSSNLPEQSDIEGLVANIRVVIDEILEKYGHIPMVRGLCNMIFNTLDLIGRIIYCIFLYILFIPLRTLYFAILDLGIDLQYFFIFLILIASELDINCPPSTPFFDWSLKSLYTLSETKGCPCLEE